MALIEGRIANRRDEMPAIARMVEGFGAEHLVPRAMVNDLNVALDEALNNIIAYGYEPGERSDIIVRLTSAAGEIVVEIEDAGRPFNPLEAPAPDLSGSLRERNVGGLGIPFIKNLVDEVTYDRIAGYNRLRLRKRLAVG
jgi:serine/threonine-protein kinase RsbW